MKKHIYLTFGISSLLLSAASARTWTSADGERTFTGDFKSFDTASEIVVVQRAQGSLSFTIDKLSQEDQKWVTEKSAEIKAAEEEASKPDLIAEKLNARVLSRLEEGRFKKAELEKKPEYYLLYFSASW